MLCFLHILAVGVNKNGTRIHQTQFVPGDLLDDAAGSQIFCFVGQIGVFLLQSGCLVQGIPGLLLDAAVDYDRDRKKGKYNPYLAMGMEKNWEQWEQYLVLAMSRCTEAYEMLPLVQDKDILDNILYSGVWVNYRAKKKKEEKT